MGKTKDTKMNTDHKGKKEEGFDYSESDGPKEYEKHGKYGSTKTENDEPKGYGTTETENDEPKGYGDAKTENDEPKGYETPKTGELEDDPLNKPRSHHLQRKIDARKPMAKLDQHLEDQFTSGRLLACISSRPGQSGRCDGYILEGK